jgi:hypothetical protein
LGISLKQPRLPIGVGSEISSRSFSSNSNKNNKASKFQPPRRPNRHYRPIIPRVIKPKGPRTEEEIEDPLQEIGDLDFFNDDSLDEFSQYGPKVKTALEYHKTMRNERNRAMFDTDMQLRLADYFTADPGSTEDLVGERRALAADIKDPLERERFLHSVQKIIDKERFNQLDLADDDYEDVDEDEDDDDEDGNKKDKMLEALAEAEEGDTMERNSDFEDQDDVDEDDNLLAKGRW